MAVARWWPGPFNLFATTEFLAPEFRAMMQLEWSQAQQRRFRVVTFRATVGRPADSASGLDLRLPALLVGHAVSRPTRPPDRLMRPGQCELATGEGVCRVIGSRRRSRAAETYFWVASRINVLICSSSSHIGAHHPAARMCSRRQLVRRSWHTGGAVCRAALSFEAQVAHPRPRHCLIGAPPTTKHSPAGGRGRDRTADRWCKTRTTAELRAR